MCESRLGESEEEGGQRSLAVAERLQAQRREKNSDGPSEQADGVGVQPLNVACCGWAGAGAREGGRGERGREWKKKREGNEGERVRVRTKRRYTFLSLLTFSLSLQPFDFCMTVLGRTVCGGVGRDLFAERADDSGRAHGAVRRLGHDSSALRLCALACPVRAMRSAVVVVVCVLCVCVCLCARARTRKRTERERA